MTQKEFNIKVKKSLKDKPPYTPKFCDVCGSYDSKKHQGVWCSRCPGRMTEYPKMTWGDCLVKSYKQGSGWFNGFYIHHAGDWYDEETQELWRKMGAETQIRKWCKIL